MKTSTGKNALNILKIKLQKYQAAVKSKALCRWTFTFIIVSFLHMFLFSYGNTGWGITVRKNLQKIYSRQKPAIPVVYIKDRL